MRFFALIEHHNRDTDEWDVRNARIGGYKHLKNAINAILRVSANGRILNEERRIVVLIQNKRMTFPQRN